MHYYASLSVSIQPRSPMRPHHLNTLSQPIRTTVCPTSGAITRDSFFEALDIDPSEWGRGRERKKVLCTVLFILLSLVIIV
jgi:hypothetical protein